MTMHPHPIEDAKELLDEANRASDPAWSSWLAFLLLLTYVAVTLASVSHKALLLNSPVKLPIINADIPLVGFFQYAPALLLLVYLSLLVQHVILSGNTAGSQTPSSLMRWKRGSSTRRVNECILTCFRRSRPAPSPIASRSS